MVNLLLDTGIHTARVALLAEKAEVQYNPDDISPEIIAEEINGLGFHADYLPDASSNDSSTLDLKVAMNVCMPYEQCVQLPCASRWSDVLF